MCPTDRGVVVASESGLHLINKEFSYEEDLANDNYFDVCHYDEGYYDVCYYEGKFFALKRKFPIVHVFTVDWTLASSIRVKETFFDTSKVSSYNRIFVTKAGISIYTYEGLCIYNHSGKQLETFRPTNDSAFSKGGFLCGIDYQNRLLFADLYKNKLLIRDESGHISEVLFPEEVTRPRDVIVNSDVIWIGTFHGACMTTL
jgi:hypothetical protein